MSSDWHTTLKDYYNNYDPVKASRAGPSIYDALPTVSSSTRRDASTSHHRSERHGHDSSRFPSSSRQGNYETDLGRTGAKHGRRGRSTTTTGWGPTNSNSDLRSAYGSDSLHRSSTMASSRGSRVHDSSVNTIGRKESRQFEPGVDLSSYGGSFYNYDSCSTIKRSQTTHRSKKSSGRDSVYDVDLSSMGGGPYHSKSSTARETSHGGFDSTSFASRTGHSSRYDSEKSSGPGSGTYRGYDSFF